jgi:iron complex transport system ATP-binding protein
MDDIFNLQNVSAGYEQCDVVQNISLTIKEKDFIGIIGPNAAGKTTLIRILAANIPVMKGLCLYKNQNILKISKVKLAQELAVVPQMFSGNLKINVYDFISLGRYPRLKGMKIISLQDIKKIKETIKMLDIEHIQNKCISELSGGQFQKVLICQSLVQEPNVLILDEPTSHLDIKHKIEIFKLLLSLNTLGITVIVVLHDLFLVRKFCKKIMLLQNGYLKADGSTDSVFSSNILEETYETKITAEGNYVV